MKMENGQGKVVRLVVAPSPWQPHPPSARGGPSPLGPAGTPLEPALTHSTSGAVTGSNARLGTSKDLSSGHGTPYQDTLSCRRYTHRAIVARRPQLLRLPARCSTRRLVSSLDRIIPGGSFPGSRRSRAPRVHSLGTCIRQDIPADLYRLYFFFFFFSFINGVPTRVPSDYGE